MKIGRASSAGESRSCPHCNATILRSAISCPMCRHMLRVNTPSLEPRSRVTSCPLLVEGTLENSGGDAMEYQLFMEVRDAAGNLLNRQIIGVGALNIYDKRIFSLRVEMSTANPAD